jgi:UDP-N-acetylmuramyl pentapeptide phosphotransferase/UDP-N-acetylglucosamine-1-phosphate transferase
MRLLRQSSLYWDASTSIFVGDLAARLAAQKGVLLENLGSSLLLGLGAAVLSWLGVRLIRNYAISRQLSATLNSTSAEPAHGGGLAILVVVLLIFMPAGLSLGDPGQVVRFAVSGALIGVIGFVDEFRTLPRFVRLAAQTLASLIFISAVPMTEIGLPFINVQLPDTVGYILTTLWVVGLSNTYNYMDGIDGLAGGQAVLAGSFWAGIGIAQGDPLVVLLGMLIAGASAGFLIYNLPPASIFMGDVGTTFLGFSLAALPILTVARGGSPRLIPTGGLIVGLFLFDAGLTFFRYILKGEGRSHDYRSHLYQRLVMLGESPYRVTLLYLLISIGFGIGGIIYWRYNAWIALLMCLLVCLVLFAWVTRREYAKTTPSSSRGV